MTWFENVKQMNIEDLAEFFVYKLPKMLEEAGRGRNESKNDKM